MGPVYDGVLKPDFAKNKIRFYEAGFSFGKSTSPEDTGHIGKDRRQKFEGGAEFMTKVFEYTLQFLIFPGFLFSSFIGLMVGWVDRKVTARVQWRVGPPWYQNFIDVVKLLFYKETLIPEGVSPALFLGMPLVALASATLVSTMILVVNFSPSQGFLGDLLVMVYLLIMPPVALILGGFASRNSLASLGASREMKLMLSYELPFILALLPFR